MRDRSGQPFWKNEDQTSAHPHALAAWMSFVIAGVTEIKSINRMVRGFCSFKSVSFRSGLI